MDHARRKAFTHPSQSLEKATGNLEIAGYNVYGYLVIEIPKLQRGIESTIDSYGPDLFRSCPWELLRTVCPVFKSAISGRDDITRHLHPIPQP